LFIKNASDVGRSWTLVDQVSTRLASVSDNYQSMATTVLQLM